MRRLALLAVLLLAAGPASAGGAPAAPADPFAVCAARRDVDRPRTATDLPMAVIARFAAALELAYAPAELAAQRAGFYWRCMGGAVQVCHVGANLPCWAKADRSRRNAGAARWCAAHPDDDGVPSYATGTETIHRWACAAGRPVIVGPPRPLDARGFAVEFWRRVPG